MKHGVVRNPINEMYLRLEGVFEYPRWVAEYNYSSPMPMWKAYAYAFQLQPREQRTPLEVLVVAGT